MSKIAVIADIETTLGFKAVGASTYPYENPAQLKSIFSKVREEDFVLIFLSEDAYKNLEEEVESIQIQPLPAIMVIPSAEGSLGIADEFINHIVQKAVGMQIG